MKKLLALLVMAVLCATLAVAISAETFVNPVAPGADPFVLKDDDGMYYLYATSGDAYGYRVFSSTNLVEWEGNGYCLIAGDVYHKLDSNGNCKFWAPEVIKYNGTYYMVYTANNKIGIATSDSPLGPFTNDTENGGFLFDEFEHINPNKNNLRVLDGNFFLDDDGTMYLYFVTVDNASFGNGDTSWSGSHIWGGVLDMDTLKIKGETIDRLVSFKWNGEDENVVEGPFMLKNGNTYYLTFSSGDYRNTDYAVCCATSDAPLGKFTRYADPVLECDDLDYADRNGEHLYGTAHHSFTYAPNGDLYIVYHAHRTGWTCRDTNDLVTGRATCIDKAGFDANGVLWAGTVEHGTPTAGEQPLPGKATLERETHYEGAFAKIPSNTIYVASY